MINYLYGENVDPMKNTETYAKSQVLNGKNHTVIDLMTTKFYYGRTFSSDGTITRWMRPVENEVSLTEPTWNADTSRWI